MESQGPSLRQLFDAVRELPVASRAGFLADVDTSIREQLERLLKAADSATSDDVDGIAADVHVLAMDEPEDQPLPLAGQRIASWQLLRLIGEGGSSTVFRAEREREGVRQEAALKVLRRGIYTETARRLFRRERQALAHLRHPGIASLIEGGVTDDGVAYIALELVDGTAITEHARVNALDLHARLRLFLSACRAAAAAHRALIVHRDLKPSNVLVSADGHVKLLDFGIAKLLDSDDETLTRLPALTPAYAAPEQFDGGLITTATDVYALGIMLAELITGQRPRGAKGRTPSRWIDEGSAPGVLPAAPRVTRKLLRGDLDNIVLKAIDEDPERRYASAAALADDIERQLEGLPVAAHPPSRLYRFRKFVQRHRAVVAITTASALGLLATLGFALWQAHVASHELMRANAMRTFMFSAFEKAEPSVPREGPPRITEVVKQAIAKARSDTRMNSGVRTELLSELGAVLRVQGNLGESREALQWNYDQAAHEFGDRDPLTVAAGMELAHTEMLTGDYAKSRSMLDGLIARTTESDGGLRAQLLLASAELATKQHELERAVREANAGLQLARAVDNEEDLATALSAFGNVQLAAGDLPNAAKTYAELLALQERLHGPQHITLASSHAALSRVWRRAGRPDDAEREIRAALAMDAVTLPKDDWRIANHLNALTMILFAKRDFAAALDAAQEGLRINRIAHGQDDLETANNLNNVGMLNARMENYAAAVPPLREALGLVTAKFGAEHYETAVTRANYGVALAHAGDWAAGEAEVRHAIASLDAAQEPDLDEIATTNEKLLRLKLDHHEPEAALPILDRIDALLARMKKPESYWEGRSALLRGAVFADMNDAARALPLLKAADDALNRSKKPDEQLRIETSLLLAKVLQANGDAAGAQRSAAEGLAQLAALRNPPLRLQQLGDELSPLTAPKTL